MKDIAIICNGGFPKKKSVWDFIVSCDETIFCDGAFSRFMRLKSGFTVSILSKPFTVIGDLDSIDPSMKADLAREGRLRHDPDQQTNDQTKAFRFAMTKIPPLTEARLNFIGATGLREDHTIANMGLLMEYACNEAVSAGLVAIRMISDYCIAFPMTDSGSFRCGKGRAVSIFSPDRDLTIVSDGLEWQTSGVRFTNWWQASLNRSAKETVRLEFSRPSKALVTLDYRAGGLAKPVSCL